MDDELDYIRRTYRVQFALGQRIEWTDNGVTRTGTVKAASNYVRVQFDDEPPGLSNIHPTDPGLRIIEPAEAGT